MSKTQSKESLVRSAWLVELRRQGKRQCTGFPENGRACALSLLAEISGGFTISLTKCAERAGLTEDQGGMIIAMNDGRRFDRHMFNRKHTFAEIADVVAGWFPE